MDMAVAYAETAHNQRQGQNQDVPCGTGVFYRNMRHILFK